MSVNMFVSSGIEQVCIIQLN